MVVDPGLTLTTPLGFPPVSKPTPVQLVALPLLAWLTGRLVPDGLVRVPPKARLSP